MATSLIRFRTVLTGIEGSPYLSTHYFDPEAGEPQDMADQLADFWNAVDDTFSSSQDWAIEAEWANIDTTTGQATNFGTITPDSGTGTASDEILPPANQVLIKWSTGVVIAGRRLVGHTYIPGLTQVANDNGNVLSSTQSVILAAAVALADQTAVHLEIFSRTGGVGESVIGVAVGGKFAVLR